jgi:hypothetical protein
VSTPYANGAHEMADQSIKFKFSLKELSFEYEVSQAGGQALEEAGQAL